MEDNVNKPMTYPLWAVWKRTTSGWFKTITVSAAYAKGQWNATKAFEAMCRDPDAEEVGLSFREASTKTEVRLHWQKALCLPES
jgi:hypothetical protein